MPEAKKISLKIDLDTYDNVRSLGFLEDTNLGSTIQAILTEYFDNTTVQARIAPIKNTLVGAKKTSPAPAGVFYPLVGAKKTDYGPLTNDSDVERTSL